MNSFGQLLRTTIFGESHGKKIEVIGNGNELIFRVAVKPTSSIKKEQRTVNLSTGEAVEISVKGRHDVCIALRMPVIVESAAAVVLADLMLREQRIPRIRR